MNILNIVEAIIFLVIPTAVVGFYFPHKFVEYARGQRVGRKPLLIWAGVLTLIYLFRFTYPFVRLGNPSLPEINITLATLLIPFLILSIHILIRQILNQSQLKQADIILDLGRLDNKFGLVSIFSMLIYVPLIFRLNPDFRQFDVWIILFIGTYISFIGFSLLNYFYHVHLTKEGLVHGIFKVKWERITGYQWDKEKEGKIPLTIKGGRETKVNIPIDQKSQIESLLQSKGVKQIEPPGSPYALRAKELPDYEIEYREKLEAIRAGRPIIPIAPLQSRLAALIIDALIIFVPLFYLVYIFFERWAYALGPYGRIITYIIILAYLGYCNSEKRKGQTIGQKMASIAVVDQNYEYLSLGKSLLRACLLCLIFILFQWQLPFFDNQALAIVAGSIVAGGLLAIGYAYLFNSATRQGIHDLLVGSYVVKWPPITEPPLPQAPRNNRILTFGTFAVGVLLFSITSVVLSTLNTESRGETIRAFRALEETLEEDENIFSARVSESPIRFNQNDSVGGTLTIDLWVNQDCGRNFDLCDQLREKAGRTAVENLGFIGRYLTMEINTTNSFDMGFAVPLEQQGNYGVVALWQQELGN